MQGPSSYTAQDVIEIQAHAGTIVLRTILDEMDKVTDYIKTPYKGVEVSDFIKNVEELRSRIKP